MTRDQDVLVIILTGGRSSRMAGRHKPGMVIGGRTVLERTLCAVDSAWPTASVVVAGPPEGLSARSRRRVTVVREEPHFAGPLAGLSAGLGAVPDDQRPVVVLGGDMPFLSAETLRALAATVTPTASPASCVDASGHLQYLCAAWYEPQLRAQLRRIGPPDGVRLGALFDGLTPQVVSCEPDELRDIDTPDELVRAVVTADGRPVPEELLMAVESMNDAAAEQGLPVELSPGQVAAILDGARAVKYDSSAGNPALAGYLAGLLAGRSGATEVQWALDRVRGHA